MNQIKPLVKAALAALLVTLSSCKSSKGELSESPRPVHKEQTMRFNIVDEPTKLDPRKARILADLNLLKMFMEGLTRTDSTGAPKLALANEISVSDDGLLYTIKLKKTSWSNGDPVTANDFLYTWKKSLTPSFPSDNAHQLFAIKNAQKIKKGELPTSLLGVEVVDDYTMKVFLEKKTPYFTKLLSMPIFFAVNSTVDRVNPNWSQKAETYVSNGPFRMDSWHHSDKIVAVKNPKYWDKNSVRLSRIEMVMVANETGLNMFENGELDWEGSPISTIPIDSIESLRESDRLNQAPSLSSFFIRVNTEEPILQNRDVRHALAYSINRKEIAEFCTNSGNPTTSLVPESMGLRDHEYFQDGDTQAAAAILSAALEEMGLVPEDLNSLTLTYISNDRSHRLAQVLQQQWFEALGVMIQLQSLERSVYFDAVSKRNFQLSFGDWFADYDDPISFLEIFETRDVGTNNTGWEKRDYTKAIAESYSCATHAERVAKLHEAETILMNDMPAIPIINSSWLYVKNRHLQDVYLAPDGSLDFKTAYIGGE